MRNCGLFQNLFIASYRFEKIVREIYSAALLFMIVLLAALLVITYVPGLTLLFRSY
jgi:TRAP-type C4-dicarboxylate transport system permease large subunit